MSNNVPKTIGELYYYFEGEFNELKQCIKNINVDKSIKEHSKICTAKNSIITHKKQHNKMLAMIIAIPPSLITIIKVFEKFIIKQ